MLQRVKNEKYDQGQYFGEGVCFRLSFKWAAITMMGGDFNYAMDKDGLSTTSTKLKFNDYYSGYSEKELADTTRKWTDSKVFSDWVGGDVLQAMTYINRWGVRFKDKSRVYGGVRLGQIIDGKVEDFLPAKENTHITFVYGYYGYDKGSPAAHAVAYSNEKYFDPNYGAYRSTLSTPAGIGQDIANFIATKESDWQQKRFIIFLLEATTFSSTARF